MNHTTKKEKKEEKKNVDLHNFLVCFTTRASLNDCSATTHTLEMRQEIDGKSKIN